jgi:hypothetical protein
VGCASTPKVDWAARVGNYTYDQAVVELGPPDKSATLTNGTRVAEWVQRASQRGSVSFYGGTGFYGGGSGVSVGTGVSPRPADRALRLTFDQEGRLLSASDTRR